MSKIKYDVSGTDPEKNVGKVFEQPRPGAYKAKLQACKLGFKKDAATGKEDKKQPRLEVVYEITQGQYKGSRLYDYLSFGESVAWRLDQFLLAFGVATKTRRKGEFDPDELVDMPCVIRVKGETYNGEYRAKVGAVMEGSDEDLDDQDFEDEEESEEDEIEPEEEESEEEEPDYSDGYPRSYLTSLQELIDESEDADAEAKLTEISGEFDIDPNEYATWPEVVDAIVEAQGLGDLDEESEEEEEEEEEEETEEVDFSSMSLADLKAACEERDLATTGNKAALVKRLEEYEAAEPF